MAGFWPPDLQHPGKIGIRRLQTKVSPTSPLNFSRIIHILIFADSTPRQGKLLHEANHKQDMSRDPEIVVIGGGIIGCSIARRLAKEGRKVAVIEKGQPGREASWAAAGMLAPLAETAQSVSEPLTRLLEASHALYPDFVRELEEETGRDIAYQKSGSLMVATDYKEAALLAGLLVRLLKAGKPVEELTAKELQERQPGLSEAAQSGLFFPTDHNVNNRDLMEALVTACAKQDVTFQTDTPVLALEAKGGRIVGVKTPGGLVRGETIINTAGAWAGSIDKSALVRPIRGQILCLQMQPQPLHHLIHCANCYLVPWPDGRVIVGATMENVGFDKSVTAEGIHGLLAAALSLAPVLKTAAIGKTWAGLRPHTSDNLPILGRGKFENYILATGHFRNGILLAPITAKLIAEIVLDGVASIDLDPFRYNRFSDSQS